MTLSYQPSRTTTAARYLSVAAWCHIWYVVVAVLLGVLLLGGVLAVSAITLALAGESSPPPVPTEAQLQAQLVPLWIAGGAIILYSWSTAAMSLYAVAAIAHRARYKVVVVTALLMCLCIPLGTVLGGISLFILRRPSAKAMFQRS